MRIGELARDSGLPIDTIRYYERLGLLPQPARAASGYRRYADADTQRLRFIRRAKALGFGLAQIAQLLELSAMRGADMADLRERATRTLEAIEARIAELARMRDGLRQLVAACPGHGALADCPILSALTEDLP